MQSQPTYDDANLILRLYELRREETMREARKWMSTYSATTVEEHMKQAPPGSKEDAYARMVLGYWEMVASFITSGVLNQEFFLETGAEMLVVWEKVRPVVTAYRQQAQNPLMWANLEKVAQAGFERMNKSNPQAYANFQKMVSGAAR